jgi:hypothetical protein
MPTGSRVAQREIPANIASAARHPGHHRPAAAHSDSPFEQTRTYSVSLRYGSDIMARGSAADGDGIGHKQMAGELRRLSFVLGIPGTTIFG